MQVPLKIDFQNMDPSEFVAARVRARIDKLPQFCDRIIGAHVTVEAPHRHRHKGNPYRVRILVRVPGETVVVGREPGRNRTHSDVYLALRDAFAATERRLADYARRRRGDIKTHAEATTGHITRLFPEDGYGFIELTNGEEIYFHRNAVSGAGFGQLMAGQPVRIAIAEQESVNGPQATLVTVTTALRAAR